SPSTLRGTSTPRRQICAASRNTRNNDHHEGRCCGEHEDHGELHGIRASRGAPSWSILQHGKDILSGELRLPVEECQLDQKCEPVKLPSELLDAPRRRCRRPAS